MGRLTAVMRNITVCVCGNDALGAYVSMHACLSLNQFEFNYRSLSYASIRRWRRSMCSRSRRPQSPGSPGGSGASSRSCIAAISACRTLSGASEGTIMSTFGVSKLCHFLCVIMPFRPLNYARIMPKLCPGLCQNYAIYAKIML